MAKKHWKITTIKKHGRRHGFVYTHKETGKIIYLAIRKHRDMWRDKLKTVNEAVAKGVAGWAVDADDVREWTRKGASAIGVYVIDTNDMYLGDVQLWLNPEKSKAITAPGRRGTAQRLVNLVHLGFRPAPVKI